MGGGHQSKQCPTHTQYALFIENTVEEAQRDQHIDDDETGIDEIVDPIQGPSDDEGEREDSCLAVMRPSYSNYPSPQTPIWMVRCVLTQSALEEDW